MDSGKTSPPRNLPGSICSYSEHTFILSQKPTVYKQLLLIKFNGMLPYKAMDNP